MIKWFDSMLMTGLPELTNTQGDLVKMLTGLLVNGANPKTVTTVSYADGVCTLDVGASHGFIINTIVSIQGSVQPALVDNGFKIKSSSATTISFDCPIAVTAETGLMVRYAPLGWTQHFASEGKACFKSSDPQYPAYLRIDDTKDTNVSAEHAKFAVVEICENMTDFDTATWQSPYDANYPLKNRRGAVDTTGWYKWYYAATQAANTDRAVPSNGVRRYVLVGNDTYFWLVVYPYANDQGTSKYAAVYGFALADYGIDTKQVLIATNGEGAPDASKNQPHMSFVNAYTKKGIAPFYDVLSFALPSYLAHASESTSDINMVATNTNIDNSLALLLPIYLYSTALKAKFKGVYLSPNNLGSDLVKTDDGMFKPISLNQPYYLNFKIG